MKHKSFAVLQLAALHTLVPLLCLCALLVVAQGVVFGLRFSSAISEISYLALVEETLFPHFFSTALCLLVGWSSLCALGKSKVGLLLRRQLPMSQIGLLWSIHTALCLLILWGVQVLVLFGCNFWFQCMASPTSWSNQTFFIDCYRGSFLHAILPLGDWLCWVRGIVAGLCLALSSGAALVAACHDKSSKVFVAALLLTGWTLRLHGSAYAAFAIACYVGCSVAALAGIFELWEEEGDA